MYRIVLRRWINTERNNDLVPTCQQISYMSPYQDKEIYGVIRASLSECYQCVLPVIRRHCQIRIYYHLNGICQLLNFRFMCVWSITLRSISPSAMASLIEFVPLLCLCILEPVRKLTHWGRVTHICVGKLTIIGSDNGLSPGRRQAIIWTNAGILIESLGTNFSEILIGIQIFSFTKMRMKMSSAKWRPFCLGLNVLTHYLRWLNAKEATPQCTEAASLVSFALSYPFVICHQLNITLYCASITTAHAFPFRVASMPAVRYDLSGGLPTCLWLFIYQDYSVICISKKLM